MYELEESFRILRVTVESRRPDAAVVAVGSALPNDGTTFVACGLARAFAEAGRSTLLVSASSVDKVADELSMRIPPSFSLPNAAVLRVEREPNLNVAYLPVNGGRRSPNSKTVDLLRELRSEYDMIVVDVESIPDSGQALELAREADSVLVAVRMGRKPSKADRSLAAELGDAIVGVVPTNPRRRLPDADQETVRTAAPALEPLPRLASKKKVGVAG